MTKTLTRADIAKKITTQLGVSLGQANDMLDATLNEIALALKSGGHAKLSGFGNFIVRTKKERVGRNPKTGVTAKISARKSITFNISQMLKRRINN